MVKNPWAKMSKKLNNMMRKDTVEIYVSEPLKNSAGEEYDNPVLLKTCKANVTTPPEDLTETESGTIRPHYYTITLAPEDTIPPNKKIFIKLVDVRQGIPGTMVEVTDFEGGLLGQTLSAVDEGY